MNDDLELLMMLTTNEHGIRPGFSYTFDLKNVKKPILTKDNISLISLSSMDMLNVLILEEDLKLTINNKENSNDLSITRMRFLIDNLGDIKELVPIEYRSYLNKFLNRSIYKFYKSQYESVLVLDELKKIQKLIQIYYINKFGIDNSDEYNKLFFRSPVYKILETDNEKIEYIRTCIKFLNNIYNCEYYKIDEG